MAIKLSIMIKGFVLINDFNFILFITIILVSAHKV